MGISGLIEENEHTKLVDEVGFFVFVFLNFNHDFPERTLCHFQLACRIYLGLVTGLPRRSWSNVLEIFADISFCICRPLQQISAGPTFFF